MINLKNNLIELFHENLFNISKKFNQNLINISFFYNDFTKFLFYFVLFTFYCLIFNSIFKKLFSDNKQPLFYFKEYYLLLVCSLFLIFFNFISLFLILIMSFLIFRKINFN